MSKTVPLEIDFLKWCTGQTTSIIASGSPPITAWVGLFTTAPTDSTPGIEVSGGSYARVNSSGKWSVPVSGSPSTVSNSSTLSFPMATADWGTVVAFGTFDAATGGNLLRWGVATKAITSGDTPEFTAGQLTSTEN